MKRSLPLLTLLLSSALLPGCVTAAGPETAPSTRLVRFSATDASTGEPVEDANVVVRPLKFFIPVEPFPDLNPVDHPASRGTTNALGTVTLDVIDNGPSHVVILAPGYATWQGEIERLGDPELETIAPWRTVGGPMRRDTAPRLRLTIEDAPVE